MTFLIRQEVEKFKVNSFGIVQEVVGHKLTPFQIIQEVGNVEAVRLFHIVQEVEIIKVPKSYSRVRN